MGAGGSGHACQWPCTVHALIRVVIDVCGALCQWSNRDRGGFDAVVQFASVAPVLVPLLLSPPPEAKALCSRALPSQSPLPFQLPPILPNP